MVFTTLVCFCGRYTLKTIITKNKVEGNEEEIEEVKEIIKFYKTISDDICSHIYDQLKEILIDLKKMSILLQMLNQILKP